jgi:hypothetical protein
MTTVSKALDKSSLLSRTILTQRREDAKGEREKSATEIQREEDKETRRQGDKETRR